MTLWCIETTTVSEALTAAVHYGIPGRPYPIWPAACGMSGAKLYYSDTADSVTCQRCLHWIQKHARVQEQA